MGKHSSPVTKSDVLTRAYAAGAITDAIAAAIEGGAATRRMLYGVAYYAVPLRSSKHRAAPTLDTAHDEYVAFLSARILGN